MRQAFFLLLFLPNILPAQFTLIPDPAFEAILIQRGFDIAPPDGMVLTSSIDAFTSFFVMGAAQVMDLTGIHDFAALEDMDVPQNTQLRILDRRFNQISDLRPNGSF